MIKNGREVLVPVIIKIGRHGLDREFLLGKTVLGVAIISSHYWAPHSKLAPFLEAMQQQADEFVKGFQRELNFKQEAENQKRFAERSRKSHLWSVPDVYLATERIIEMEYVENATNISHILDHAPERGRPRLARQIASRFLYAILTHILVHQEFHGDLHPGNVLIGPDGEMFLIDWGNCVDLKGKWKPLWDYLFGALSADVELLTSALINISADPEQNRKREAEIQCTLAQTLEKKNITPLTRNFLIQLQFEGVDGFHRRLQVVLHLMSNTQHLGLVVKSEYLHLCRSIAAIVGTYAQLYKGLPRFQMPVDFIMTLTQFPMALLLDRIADKRSAYYIRILHRLTFLPIFKKSPAPKYIGAMHRPAIAK